MSRIIIVCGLPGTGKTTFAAALADALKAVHLNTDKIRWAMGKQGLYSVVLKTAIYESMAFRAKDALVDSRDVVLDGTFYKRKFRKPFFQLGEKFNAPITWIEIIASDETIRQRVSHTRPFTEADYQVHQKVKQALDPYPPDRLVLDSEAMSIDQMIEKAKKHLNG
jgi:predicted kinase